MTLTQKIKLQGTLTAAHQSYAKNLKTHASFKVSNPEIGEDLVQQTFLKTWSYLARGGEIEKMRSFLYHVLNNLIIDEYRKKKVASLNVLIEKGFDPCALNDIDLIDTLDGKMAIHLIQHLPVRYQRVMHLKYVDDLSIKEISYIVGIPKNTVTVQIHRGIKKIRILYR